MEKNRKKTDPQQGGQTKENHENKIKKRIYSKGKLKKITKKDKK